MIDFECTKSGDFFTKGMTPEEVAAFEEHIELCPDCQKRLENEAGPDAVWQSVRELLIYRRAEIDGSDSRPPSSLSDTNSPFEIPASPAIKSVLPFLSPTDDPAMVGRIGSYEIAGLVGRGGTGVVLKGFDRSLNRNVAIKLLDPAIADIGAARLRFSREARAMAAIAHEHLVAVYEVNEHAGIPYFVMEYVPGGSLERRLRLSGPMDVISIVRIGVQVAKALAAAHAQGLVHRDIKPGNILLDRGTERVRVVDFGLVRVANEVSCTRSGTISGTPQYMSPEQVRAEACDAQSDLFSLGSVLYTLCTGHPPFRADTVYGMMQRIVRDAPRPIREQNSGVPAWLEQFIGRLMSKDRSSRFQSASEVAAILERRLAHLLNADLAPQARPERDGHPAIRRSGSPRRTRLAAIVVSGALVVAIAVAPWSAWKPPSNAANSGSQTERQSDTAEAAADEGPSHAPKVPLWNQDDIRRLERSLNTLESTWSSTADRDDRDPFLKEYLNLKRALDQLTSEISSRKEDPM